MKNHVFSFLVIVTFTGCIQDSASELHSPASPKCVSLRENVPTVKQAAERPSLFITEEEKDKCSPATLLAARIDLTIYGLNFYTCEANDLIGQLSQMRIALNQRAKQNNCPVIPDSSKGDTCSEFALLFDDSIALDNQISDIFAEYLKTQDPALEKKICTMTKEILSIKEKLIEKSKTSNCNLAKNYLDEIQYFIDFLEPVASEFKCKNS